MGKSINPMFSFTIRGEAPFGSAPSLIVLMSLQPAIPRQVALLQCLPPLHRLDSMFHLPAGTVNHHLARAGEFSTGRTRNFQPELTPRWASATCLEKVKLPAERVLHIDHLFARMQRLNTYEAKTNAMTRIGSNLSQVLPPPFSCE